MTNPGPGFRQMSGQMILDVLQENQEQGENAENLRRREREQKAQAFAAVCHSQGVSLKNMTPAQRAYAEAHAKALQSRGANSRPGGFSIDASGRDSWKR